MFIGSYYYIYKYMYSKEVVLFFSYIWDIFIVYILGFFFWLVNDLLSKSVNFWDVLVYKVGVLFNFSFFLVGFLENIIREDFVRYVFRIVYMVFFFLFFFYCGYSICGD